MSDLTLRSVKGSPLTNEEVDANFTALNNTKLETTAVAADVNPAGTNIAAALMNTVKIASNQTIDGVKTFLQLLVSNELRARTTDGLDIAKSDGTSLIRVGKDGTKTGVAEGIGTVASGAGSHAEGSNTTAGGNQSHAEGAHTTASGDFSHAEGDSTTASGDYSHAEGKSTLASGTYSSATGLQAKAIHDGSRVEADGQMADVESTAANQYTARFANGYRFLGGIASFFGGLLLDDQTADRPLALNSSKQVVSLTNSAFRDLISAERKVTVRTVTDDTVITANDRVVLVNEIGGGVVDLPLASAVDPGFIVTVKKIGDFGDVSVQCVGPDLIDGAASKTLTTQYESITIVSDGTNWYSI